MFSSFKYETLPLKDILLDDRNPRLVTQSKLTKQKDILSYLYEHEALDDLVRKIATKDAIRAPSGHMSSSRAQGTSLLRGIRASLRTKC